MNNNLLSIASNKQNIFRNKSYLHVYTCTQNMDVNFLKPKELKETSFLHVAGTRI